MSTATTASPLHRAKELFTVPLLAAQLFPFWTAGRSCRSPFRDDRNPSFSVFDDGQKWKDHATVEGGDVVDFLAKARGITTADAARELIAMAGLHSLPARGTAAPLPAPAKPVAVQVRPISAELYAGWLEGIKHLMGDEKLQRQIEAWRSWPAGTVRALADEGLLGCPLGTRGIRGTAFAVQCPCRDELGLVSIFDAGYHLRHKPAKDEAHAKWSYTPNGTPALPFVIAGGFIGWAETIVVTEGQFDAVTLAAAAGWLTYDTSWPESVVVFGTRGAGAWRPLLDHWGQFWPRAARFVLFADADKAGAGWLAPGSFKDALTSRGHAVRVIRPTQAGVKDINDLHRLVPLTHEIISTWIATKRTTP